MKLYKISILVFLVSFLVNPQRLAAAEQAHGPEADAFTKATEAQLKPEW